MNLIFSHWKIVLVVSIIHNLNGNIFFFLLVSTKALAQYVCIKKLRKLWVHLFYIHICSCLLGRFSAIDTIIKILLQLQFVNGRISPRNICNQQLPSIVCSKQMQFLLLVRSWHLWLSWCRKMVEPSTEFVIIKQLLR